MGRTFGDLQFGQVVANAEKLVVIPTFVAPSGRQSPPHQGDESDTGKGDRSAHRRKIEQTERFAAFPIAGNDNIRRRPDQGHGASKQRTKRQWHQQQ